MAVEIKELVIKATVDREADTETTDTNPVEPSVDTHSIVRSCVEQVLNILKREKER